MTTGNEQCCKTLLSGCLIVSIINSGFVSLTSTIIIIFFFFVQISEPRVVRRCTSCSATSEKGPRVKDEQRREKKEKNSGLSERAASRRAGGGFDSSPEG